MYGQPMMLFFPTTSYLTLYDTVLTFDSFPQTLLTFNNPAERKPFTKIVGKEENAGLKEKKEMLENSIFFFSHNVF